ncbi:MAG TPA: hypothetical protein VGM86_13040, partial [Thermoanaerobaculia bacterium]
MKPRVSSQRPWVTIVGLTAVVVGGLANLFSLAKGWSDFVEWLNKSLGFRQNSPLVQFQYWLLPFLVLFLVTLIAFLKWVIAHTETIRVGRRSGQYHSKGVKVREAYIADISEYVTNQLKKSTHNARFVDLGLSIVEGARDSAAEGEVCSSFAKAFDHFKGNILLLGNPGAGKSTTLLHLAKRLLEDV